MVRSLARPSVAAILALVLAVPAAPAQQAPAKARPAATAQPVKGATVEGITEYTLANGLRVLLFPDPTKATTTVNVTYFVGSRHEAYGETGMAHLLEHLVFKGTPRHRNIPQELTERGARPNGTTWLDRTNYFETFPASDANLAWALDLEADRMVHSFIAKKDLESEMTVVRNEFELGENNPGGVLEERVLSTAFLWHNYGKSTIGARSDIEQVPIERLQGFYRKYYQPDNAMLVVAGRFDPAAALRLVGRTFGRIPRPARTGEMRLWPTYTRDPVQDGEREVTLRRVGDVQVLSMAYHVPSGADPDFPAVDILAEVIGDSPSGRLYKALVEPKLAASVSSYAYQLREPGVLLATAEVRKEQSLADAERAMRAALDSVVARPPSAEEVDRARTALLKNIDLLLNNSDRVGLNLSEWAAMGDWRLLFLHRDRLRKVTPADVQRVAAAYLKPDNRTVGRFIPAEKPDRAPLPGDVDVAALVAGYKGDTALAAGEAFDPSTGNVERRVTRGALPSGLEVAYLPKRNRGQTVNATLALRYGTLERVTGKAVAADLAADMLLRGTKSKTRQQIKDELDRLKARVFLGGGPTQLNVNVETTGPNLPAVLRLLGEVLREPAFDAKEFEELRQENLAGIEQQRSEPTALAVQAYARYVNPYPKGDPRYTPTFDEQVADYTAATLADARDFYAGFLGASHGELAVVGDFDVKEVDQVVREVFGAWKSPAPYARIPREAKPVEPTGMTIETPDKANAFFLAGETVPMRDDDPDYPAMMLANYMMGGGFLNSRLAVRIRQKEGLSYGVGSMFSASPLDRSGGWQAYAIYAPQNAAKLEQAFREEVERAAKDGFAPEEVAKAKEGYLESRKLSRSQDGPLAGQLGTGLFLDRTLAWDAQFEEKIRALTPEQVSAAFRRVVDPAKLVIVKAGDFKKATPQP